MTVCCRVTSELTLQRVGPGEVVLLRNGSPWVGVFDVAALVAWSDNRCRTRDEAHLYYLWRQGRRICATCGVTHFGSPHEECA